MSKLKSPIAQQRTDREVPTRHNLIRLHPATQGRRMSTLTLTITARGQLALCKDVQQHLDVRPGEKIELHKLPGGRIVLAAARPKGSIDKFIGLLAGRTSTVATLEEIEEAAATDAPRLSPTTSPG
jgi:bifunctional DNA-binding transcriptional regulator/antitoxin component of YhaV-PrlF toxin-antitoxin module